MEGGTASGQTGIHSKCRPGRPHLKQTIKPRQKLVRHKWRKVFKFEREMFYATQTLISLSQESLKTGDETFQTLPRNQLLMTHS